MSDTDKNINEFMIKMAKIMKEHDIEIQITETCFDIYDEKNVVSFYDQSVFTIQDFENKAK